MNISCRKLKCKFNDNFVCRSNKIFIDKELNCQQYYPLEDKKVHNTSCNVLDNPPKISSYRHNKDCKIFCRADCIFNKDCHCLSNGIFVNGQTKKANQNNLVNVDEGVSEEKLQETTEGEAICFSFAKQ